MSFELPLTDGIITCTEELRGSAYRPVLLVEFFMYPHHGASAIYCSSHVEQNFHSYLAHTPFFHLNTKEILPVITMLMFILYFFCRGSSLQDSSLCPDHSHSDRHPYNDLHCHREIPGDCLPTENEAAILSQKSIQDARYAMCVRVA